jgi:hypothetical protein
MEPSRRDGSVGPSPPALQSARNATDDCGLLRAKREKGAGFTPPVHACVGGAAGAHVTPATLSDVVAPSASRDTRRAKSELRLRRLSWRTSSPALLPDSAIGPGCDTDQDREEHGDD